MVQFGEIIEAKIIDENDLSYFAQKDGITFNIPKDSTDETYENGQIVEGLIYQDKDETNM